MITVDYRKKTAVVTGAGGTLCSQIAIHLATHGAKVALVGRTREKLEATEKKILDAGGTVLVCPADVNCEKEIEEVAINVLRSFGTCDFLINGAGGNSAGAMTKNPAFVPEEIEDGFEGNSFFNLDMDTYRSVLLTNTVGSVIPARVFGRQMAKNGGGAIINFASMNTYCPLTKVPAYAMSKAAISNFTQWLSAYLAPANIRVNAIAPGFFVNERSAKFLGTPETGLTPRGEQVISHTPAGRFGVASDLLSCVDFLLDDAGSGFVTGITVPVDGGFLAKSGV